MLSMFSNSEQHVIWHYTVLSSIQYANKMLTFQLACERYYNSFHHSCSQPRRCSMDCRRERHHASPQRAQQAPLRQLPAQQRWGLGACGERFARLCVFPACIYQRTLLGRVKTSQLKLMIMMYTIGGNAIACSLPAVSMRLRELQQDFLNIPYDLLVINKASRYVCKHSMAT